MSSSDEFSARPISAASGRGAEPEPPVSVHPHMVFGAGLTDALDYLVLLHCLFLAGAGKPFTVADVIASLQAEGIRASNGSGLVGRDAVRGSFRRLAGAGFIRRTQSNAKGRFGATAYELYRHPVYNPDWAPEDAPLHPEDGTKPQVAPQTAVPFAVRPAETCKTAGGTVDGTAVAGSPGAGNAVDGIEGKTAGGTADGSAVHGGAAPPTPPYREEEDSSSPKPSSVTAVTASVPATVVAAGEEFLAELPGRWACGRRSAAELAPLLAEAVHAQGWSLGEALVQYLTRRSPARRSTVSVLRDRIEDLPRYRASRASAPDARSRLAGIPGQQLPLDAAEHTRTADSAAAAVQPEQLGRARELLLTLTGPWALGPESADRLAPQLAAKAVERGWAFDDRLRSELMKNPGGVHNYELILETHRIGRLPDRASTLHGQARRAQASSRQTAIDACGLCDAYGQIERGGAALLCRHDASSAPVGEAPQQPSVSPERAPDSDATGGQKPEGRNLSDLFAAMRKADF
ncbi:hypothetical protein [Streptomyces sp. NPDC050485]|uniref:hypothetical protein n=1 Tax=Streptomyces sp. NPDC050485 TaxID=3365617 RepID=UPI0037AF06F5